MGQHNVKIAEARWKAAMAKARSEGRTLTSVIDDALAAYIGEAPRRPGAGRPGAGRSRRQAQDAETRQWEQEKREIPQAAFSDPPVNPLPAPEPRRCAHAGVRVTGGWCVPCQRTVQPGGG